MTTSTPEPLPDLLMSEPDPTAKARRQRVEFWQICWLISLSSLLISLYALFLSQRLAPAASQYDLDRAALVLANELSTLSVKHNRFGDVGLVQIKDANKMQMCMNSLQATLRLDGIIARQLGFDSMTKLVAADAKEAHLIADGLARLERELVKPVPSQSLGRESFAEIVRKVLNHTGAGNRLRSLKISLGTLKNSKIGSKVPLPVVAQEDTSFFADGLHYRTHIKVPIWEEMDYEFYEQADKPTLVPVSQFVPIESESLASVVMVEAEFDVAERGRLSSLRKMQSCAIIGGASHEKSNSAFMLSFPQGYLSSIHCLNDLFLPDEYVDVKGEWLQAIWAEIPGPGHLGYSTDEKLKKEPHLAAINLLYDYIFSVGPELLPATLKRLLNEPISTLTLHSDEKASSADAINCGLFKDTGAAAFALSKQSQPGGEGQKVLASAFSGQAISELMPASTFPLVVDSDGTMRMPQEAGFDLAFLREFQDALYKTNIAGIESMQIAATVVQRMQNSMTQSEKNLASLNEEIQSLKRSLESASGEKSGDADRKMNQLSEQVASLLLKQQEEEARKTRSQKIKDTAMRVRKNGRQAARSSYEIASHMSAFAAQGIKHISAPFKGFLLGRSVVFVPHTTPVDESELYELADAEAAESASSDKSQSWTSKLFDITQMAEESFYVEGKPITEYWQTVPVRTVNRPLYVILSSTELLKKEASKLYLCRQTPFDSGAIGKSELCYLAPQCIESGKDGKASWTVLMRDLVYSITEKSGQPLQSIRPDWCRALGMHEETCPGLAVELQIRTPLPKLNGSLSSLYLQDPEGSPPVSLYPPLPAELL